MNNYKRFIAREGLIILCLGVLGGLFIGGGYLCANHGGFGSYSLEQAAKIKTEVSQLIREHGFNDEEQKIFFNHINTMAAFRLGVFHDAVPEDLYKSYFESDNENDKKTIYRNAVADYDLESKWFFSNLGMSLMFIGTMLITWVYPIYWIIRIVLWILKCVLKFVGWSLRTLGIGQAVTREGLILLGVIATSAALVGVGYSIASKETMVMTKSQFNEVTQEVEKELTEKRNMDPDLFDELYPESDRASYMYVSRVLEAFEKGYLDHLLPKDIHERYAGDPDEKRIAAAEILAQFSSAKNTPLLRTGQIGVGLGFGFLLLFYPIRILIGFVRRRSKSLNSNGGTSDYDE